MKIKAESFIYGDIIQENFIDGYYNLTLKTIMGFKWSSKYCSNAKFIMKLDDDVVVNTFDLLNYLNRIYLTDRPENTLYCYLLENKDKMDLKGIC